jgi:hypothetical protein
LLRWRKDLNGLMFYCGEIVGIKPKNDSGVDKFRVAKRRGFFRLDEEP